MLRGLIAEADTPWGRLRVTVWTRRPLSKKERAVRIRLLEVQTEAWVTHGGNWAEVSASLASQQEPDAVRVEVEVVG